MAKKEYRILIFFLLIAGLIYSFSYFDSSVNKSNERHAEDAVEPRHEPRPKAEYSVPVFGHFAMGHEVKSFVECGSVEGAGLWVEDHTDRVQKLWEAAAPAGEPYASVFGSVLMRRETNKSEGFGAEFDQKGVVTAINYWPIEGFNCDYPWDRFNVRAFGNEPFWLMEISNSTLTLSRPDLPKRSWNMNMHQSPFKSMDGGVSLEIVEKPCQDGMSGNWFGSIITLTYDDHRLKGCGMKGTGV